MNGVMIALLPQSAEWSKVDPPHCTLVYSGEVKDHPESDFHQLLKDATSIALLTRPLVVRTKGLEVFGEADERVDVVTLDVTPELDSMRNFVFRWNKSKWQEFRPHITVGPTPSELNIGMIPPNVRFDRVLLAWGDQKYTFNMKLS